MAWLRNNSSKSMLRKPKHRKSINTKTRANSFYKKYKKLNTMKMFSTTSATGYKKDII